MSGEGKDLLLQIEAKWQERWAAQKQFESNAPESYRKGDAKKKFFVTFPYPYSNGRLHLGHLFTVSKSEFAAGWHMMNGYNTLFPFAFHVTGQPICGAAKKLEKELQQNQEEVDQEQPEEQPQAAKEPGTDAKVEKEMNLGQYKSRKSKATSKASSKSQSEILQEMGVPKEDIPKFVDPYKWVDFFPAYGIKDMKAFGARVDWRRSFITTDANPVYDAFVQWHMHALQRGGYINYGKRNTIWAAEEKQPCMDHDRLSGEGVQVQEYVLVLTELVKDGKNAQNAKINSLVRPEETVYLACATLRPETMCGQTNVWVKPDAEYLLVRAGGNRVLVMGEHAARNAAWQEMNNGLPAGEIDRVATIQGSELLNCVVHAPLTPYERIPVYPLMTISMTKGTGVVTSVPSDAPDDYAALRDVKRNEDGIVDKYGLDLSLLNGIEPIGIIEIPEQGRCVAARLCEERGVKNQWDRELLKEIKELCYTKGFYEGVMVEGVFSGKRVQDCKALCKEYLLGRNEALVYAEPESEVISRSGNVCVVAQTEQWFIDYGEEKWKAVALEALKGINCYSEEVANQFQRVLEWLKQWALSRTFGLGTRIPWDPKFLVESLSDSTIYNAFYTIAHVLQNGNLNGQGCCVERELLDDDFFDYCFDLVDEIKPKHAKHAEVMQKLRQSFQYYYPVDLRCSGKDLVPNHLTFFIYNHCAVWASHPEYWPKGIRANGHLMLNDQKMAKSTGNFLTAYDAIKLFSADGVRLALADAGDGNDDANFKSDTASQGSAKLLQLMNSHKALLTDAEEKQKLDTTKDLIFQAQFYDCAVRCNKAYEKCMFREGTIILMNEMLKARDLYVKTCEQQAVKPALQLIKQFITIHTKLLAVICPHIAEEINEQLLGASASIFTTPIAHEELTQKAEQFARYINTYDQICQMISRLKMRWLDVTKPKKDGTVPPKPKVGIVYVATEFPEWQAQLIQFLGQEYTACEGVFGKDVMGKARDYALQQLNMDAKDTKKIIKCATDFIALSKTEGASAFVVKMPFDEKVVYSEYAFLICSSLQLEKADVFNIGEGPMTADKCAAAQPGRPIIFFEQ